jgi:hypothetical protein
VLGAISGIHSTVSLQFRRIVDRKHVSDRASSTMAFRIPLRAFGQEKISSITDGDTSGISGNQPVIVAILFLCLFWQLPSENIDADEERSRIPI